MALSLRSARSAVAPPSAAGLLVPLLRLSRASFVLRQPACQRSYATPSGPPPKGFRLRRPIQWHEEKESTLDRAGRFFLFSEMARGMYVALEQFFRPP